MEQKVRSGRRGSEVVTPPDGGWGWMIIASCFLVTICTRAVTRCVSIFFVEFQLHFDRDYSTTAWIHSLVDCTTMLCAPLGSLMERHLSCRATVLMGGLLACTGLVLSSFASSVEFLYVSLGILTGVGFALCYTPAIGMVGRYFSNRKALAYGIAMSGSGIGTFILAPVVQLLIELYSWRGALLILGAFVSNLCVCGALMRPVEATQHLRGKEQDYLAAPQDGEKVKQQDVKTSENQAANRRITNYELDSGKLLPEKLAKVLLSKDPSDSSLRKAKTAECVIFSNNKLTDKILAEIKLTDPRLADGSTLEDLKLVENLNFSNKLAKIDDNVDPKLPLAIDAELEDPSVDQVRLSEIKQLAPDAHGMSAISQPSSAPRSRCWGRGRSLLAVDLSFLLMPDFLLLSVSFLFLAYGCSVPIVYLVPYAVSVGAEHQHAAYLMSIFGVSGIVGNITFGWITDRRCLRRYRMLSYMLAIAMEGLCCLFLPSLRSITLLFLFSVVYGYFDGAYVALIPVVTSDVVGPAHLTSALGVVYFLHAVPYLVSPPIGGLLVDRTGDYTAAFYLSAASLLFSPVFISIFMAIRRCWSSRTHSEPLKV